MNWAIKIISKTLMTKISHISWGVTTKGFDKGIYSNHHVILADFDSFILPKAWLRGINIVNIFLLNKLLCNLSLKIIN